MLCECCLKWAKLLSELKNITFSSEQLCDVALTCEKWKLLFPSCSIFDFLSHPPPYYPLLPSFSYTFYPTRLFTSIFPFFLLPFFPFSSIPTPSFTSSLFPLYSVPPFLFFTLFTLYFSPFNPLFILPCYHLPQFLNTRSLCLYSIFLLFSLPLPLIPPLTPSLPPPKILTCVLV